MIDLTSIQVRESIVMQSVFLKFLHRKCMGKIFIGCKCCVKHLNKKILKHLVDTTNELNFRIVCNCFHELLNIFEDLAQRVHTIVIKNHVSLIFRTFFMNHVIVSYGLTS